MLLLSEPLSPNIVSSTAITNMTNMKLEQILNLWTRFDKVFIEATDAVHYLHRAKQMLMLRAKAWKTAEMPERLYLAYEQFLIATASLRHAQIRGEVSQMGTWAAWAVAEEPAEHFAQPMEIGRFYDFRKHREIFTSPGCEAASVLYFTGLYDYARRRTAYKEICEAVWPDAMQIFVNVMSQHPMHIQRIEALVGCTMLTWASRESPEKASYLAKKIEDFISNEALPAEIRGLFCLTLSTNAGFHSTQSIAYWANRTLAEFNKSLSSLDRAQLMVTVLNMESKGRPEAEAALAQLAIVRAKRNKGLTMLGATRDSGQTTDYIAPYFVRTMRMAASDLVLKGLQTWYQQGDDVEPLDPNSMLFSMPFGETSSLLLCGANLQEVKRDSQIPLVNISRKMMEFLSTYTTVAGADNSNLPVPDIDRVGYPQERVEGLVEALRDAYCPDGFRVPEALECQLILPTEGHPIQATQLMCWGRTFPICSSLAKPRPDRAPKSVLIWCGEVLSGEMELEMVEAAFKGAGAQVKIVTPKTSTPAEFISEYENEVYDVLWIASHGELDHWSPHDIQLLLARDKSAVMLEDLWNRVPEHAQRRLLVLNICDGARFGDPGLLPRVGLAAGLSGPKQATISHLWPVRSLPSAAFGAHLAHHIANGTPYFDAYCATLKALRKAATDIGFELETLYGQEFQLVKSLKSSSADFSRIETWGSAAFFQ